MRPDDGTIPVVFGANRVRGVIIFYRDFAKPPPSEAPVKQLVHSRGV